MLKALYSEILVPEAVWRELTRPLVEAWEELPGYIDSLLEARRAGWLKVEDVRGPEGLRLLEELRHLDPGEREAIALAVEKGVSVILTNDKLAHDEALSRGLEAKWFTQILLDALKKGLLGSVDEYEQALKEAIRAGLWVSKEVIKKALEQAKCVKKPYRP